MSDVSDLCVCGHHLADHDEHGVCRPSYQQGASQGMGVRVADRCTYDCRSPRPVAEPLATRGRLARRAVRFDGVDPHLALSYVVWPPALDDPHAGVFADVRDLLGAVA